MIKKLKYQINLLGHGNPFQIVQFCSLTLTFIVLAILTNQFLSSNLQFYALMFLGLNFLKPSY